MVCSLGPVFLRANKKVLGTLPSKGKPDEKRLIFQLVRNFLLRGKLLFFLWDLGTLEGQFRRVFPPVLQNSSSKKMAREKKNV